MITPSALTRKPVPCAIGLSLAAVMMVTIAPFEDLAIVGMSFLVGADCPGVALATTKISKRSLGREFVVISMSFGATRHWDAAQLVAVCWADGRPFASIA